METDDRGSNIVWFLFYFFFPSYIFGWPKNCVPVSFLFVCVCVPYTGLCSGSIILSSTIGKREIRRLIFSCFVFFLHDIGHRKKEPCGLAVKKKKVVAIFTIFLCVLFNGRKLKKKNILNLIPTLGLKKCINRFTTTEQLEPFLSTFVVYGFEKSGAKTPRTRK